MTFEEYARNNVHEILQEALIIKILPRMPLTLKVPDKIGYLNINLNITSKSNSARTGRSRTLCGELATLSVCSSEDSNNEQHSTRSNDSFCCLVAANVALRPKLAFFEGVCGVISQVMQPIFENIYAPHEDKSGRKMVGVA